METTTEKVIKSSLVINALVTYKGRTIQQDRTKTETFNVRCLDENDSFRLVEISDRDDISFLALVDLPNQRVAKVKLSVISRARKEKNLSWEKSLAGILKKEIENFGDGSVQTLKIQSVDRIVKTIREEKVSMTEFGALSSVEVTDENEETESEECECGDCNEEYCDDCDEYFADCNCGKAY